MSMTYRGLVLERPRAVLAVLLLVLAFFAVQSRTFALDASADALLLENDRDLKIYHCLLWRATARKICSSLPTGRKTTSFLTHL